MMMNEQEILRNKTIKRFVVKVNDLFVQDNNNKSFEPIRLYKKFTDGTRFNDIDEAKKVANEINGEVYEVIDTEIHTRCFTKIK